MLCVCLVILWGLSGVGEKSQRKSCVTFWKFTPLGTKWERRRAFYLVLFSLA